LADGPVLQRAAERALTQKVTLVDALALVRRLRATVQIPLMFMTYYNLIFQYGDVRLATEAAAAGVDGLIVPDLPPEEAGPLDAAARAAGLHLIYLIAPTTPASRIKLIAERAGGFLYYVSLTGITGSKLPALDEVGQGVSRIKRVTDLPVAVGFGVSTPDEAGRIARVADGVIVASALIKRLQGQPDARRRREELAAYVASLKAALPSNQVLLPGGSR
jgi:tryptophan synthase alpha chain